MIRNEVIDAMLARKSLRRYEDRMPSDEVIETVVRVGQQAPFAAQLGSVLLRRGPKGVPFAAPLLFTICVDAHRLETIMAGRGWPMVTTDLTLLLFGFQDAVLMAQNMVMAAESLGMGSCFLGGTPFRADEVIERFDLPRRVFPLVELTMGYPAENPPPRPRYPMDFHLFEDKYPDFSDADIEDAARVMDEGYLAQDYYKKAKAMVKLEGDRKETFTYDDYSWTEHMGRKWGQWFPSPDVLLEQLEQCGFDLRGLGERPDADPDRPG